MRGNWAVCCLLLSVPIVAEGVAALRGEPPLIGIEILLYWPFTYAYLGLASMVILALNIALSIRFGKPFHDGALLGVIVAMGWACAAFMVVAQVHMWRGGTL